MPTAAVVPIFPVVLVPLEKETDWLIIIQRNQYVHFSSWQDPKSFKRQLDLLLTALHERFADLAGDQPDPEIQYLNEVIATLEIYRISLLIKSSKPRTSTPLKP